MTDALNRFLHHKANIDALLAEIATASSNHFDTIPDAINYGHVGTLADIHTRLGDIADMLAKRGEYAE